VSLRHAYILWSRQQSRVVLTIQMAVNALLYCNSDIPMTSQALYSTWGIGSHRSACEGDIGGISPETAASFSATALKVTVSSWQKCTQLACKMTPLQYVATQCHSRQQLAHLRNDVWDITIPARSGKVGLDVALHRPSGAAATKLA